MPKPTIGDIQAAVPDPMLSDNYVLSIPNVPTGDSSTPLMMQCRTAVRPGYTINNVELQLFGHTVEHAGNLTYTHDLPIEYVENRNGVIHTILDNWADLIRDHETQHGAYKNEYSRPAYLKIFDQRGRTVKEYRIVNIWPNQVPDTQFDGQAANLITISVTFKFDYVEVVR